MESLTETEEATLKTVAEQEADLKNNFVFCSILVGENLNNRINRHIDKLKSIASPGQSRQRWVIDAITEKLSTENLSVHLPREKIISLKISQDLHEKILKRVETMRKVRKSFSKKQWIVEAISDKLDRDEKEIQKKLSDFTE